jgi:hypothetical protein
MYVLICEEHPVSRGGLEMRLGRLHCHTVTVFDGSGDIQSAMQSEVVFDTIMMETKLLRSMVLMSLVWSEGPIMPTPMRQL